MEQASLEITDQHLPDDSKVKQTDYPNELLSEDVTKPLKPNTSKYTALFNDYNKEIKKELTQLMRMLMKLSLNESTDEQDKDSSLDMSCLKTDDTLSKEEEQSLSSKVKDNSVEDNPANDIQDIMNSTQKQIAKLNLNLQEIDKAEQEIENNITSTLKDIDETYQSLLDDVCRQINAKREQLILEAEIYRHENLITLKMSRKDIESQLKQAHNIISLGENILQFSEQYDNTREIIIATYNNIGRISAARNVEKLLNISFEHPLNSCKEEIVEQISKFGCISRAMIQISNIEERPAGLFVKWHINDPEYNAEEHIFIVEKANKEIYDTKSNQFEVVYTGSETFCFIRNIPVNKPITLRVRAQTDNIAKSAHHITRTSVLPYTWELDNKDYVISKNNTLAAKLTNTISTLFSQGPQYDADHIIEFKFLEVSQKTTNNEGIALVYDPQGSQDTLKRQASFMITSQGKIFMDGEEKLIRLPKIHFDTVITISALRKNDDVLRLNIESENKCVTYDWRVQTPLYFAARFAEHQKWILMIK